MPPGLRRIAHAPSHLGPVDRQPGKVFPQLLKTRRRFGTALLRTAQYLRVHVHQQVKDFLAFVVRQLDKLQRLAKAHHGGPEDQIRCAGPILLKHRRRGCRLRRGCRRRRAVPDGSRNERAEDRRAAALGGERIVPIGDHAVRGFADRARATTWSSPSPSSRRFDTHRVRQSSSTGGPGRPRRSATSMVLVMAASRAVRPGGSNLSANEPAGSSAGRGTTAWQEQSIPATRSFCH